MRAVHIFSDGPTRNGTQQGVCGEVILPQDPGEAHPTRQSVNPYLLPGSGVFAGEHSGRGPGDDGVTGDEGRVRCSVTLEEMPPCILQVRSFAKRDVFDSFTCDVASDHGSPASRPASLAFALRKDSPAPRRATGAPMKSPRRTSELVVAEALKPALWLTTSRKVLVSVTKGPILLRMVEDAVIFILSRSWKQREHGCQYTGCQVKSTLTGISFLIGTKRKDGGSILKSVRVDGTDPVIR